LHVSAYMCTYGTCVHCWVHTDNNMWLCHISMIYIYVHRSVHICDPKYIYFIKCYTSMTNFFVQIQKTWNYIPVFPTETIYTRIYIHVYIYTYMYTYIRVYIYTYVYICIYICIYIYMYMYRNYLLQFNLVKYVICDL
jgi:hypothetical protein